jgi:hypothetical protein
VTVGLGVWVAESGTVLEATFNLIGNVPRLCGRSSSDHGASVVDECDRCRGPLYIRRNSLFSQNKTSAYTLTDSKPLPFGVALLQHSESKQPFLPANPQHIQDDRIHAAHWYSGRSDKGSQACCTTCAGVQAQHCPCGCLCTGGRQTRDCQGMLKGRMACLGCCWCCIAAKQPHITLQQQLDCSSLHACISSSNIHMHTVKCMHMWMG